MSSSHFDLCNFSVACDSLTSPAFLELVWFSLNTTFRCIEQILFCHLSLKSRYSLTSFIFPFISSSHTSFSASSHFNGIMNALNHSHPIAFEVNNHLGTHPVLCCLQSLASPICCGWNELFKMMLKTQLKLPPFPWIFSKWKWTFLFMKVHSNLFHSCFGWEHKFYYLSKFQLYNTVLTILSTWHIRSSDLVLLMTESLYLFPTLPYFSHLKPLQPPFYSLFIWGKFFLVLFKITQINDTMWYVSFCNWLILLIKMSSSFTHVVINRGISFFIKA